MDDDDRLFEPEPDKFFDTFVGPKGPTNPRIYIIGEAAGQEEVEQQLPFVGKAGKMLDRLIEASGIPSDQLRFWNAIPYRPYEISEHNRVRNRTPTDEEIELYKVFVHKDIERTKPACIVAAGRAAMLALGIDERVNRARDTTYFFKGIPVFCTFHPSYVMRDEHTRSFDDVVFDLRRAWGHKERKAPTKAYEVVDVFDFARIRDDLNAHDTLVLDYEASSLRPYHVGFHLAGIALKGLGVDKSYYIRFWDFWRRRDDFEIPQAILDDIGDLLASKRLIVFNMQYECAVTLVVFGRYLTNVVDVMLWNRMLGGYGTLKALAQQRLNVVKWNTEIDVWNKCCETLFKNCSTTYKGNARHEMVYISEGSERFFLDPAKTFEDVLTYLIVKSGIKDLDFVEHDMKKREYEVFKAFDTLDKIVQKYYQGEQLEAFCSRFFKLLRERSEAQDVSIRYTDLPLEITAPYAVEDIVHTDELYHIFGKEIEEKGLTRTAHVYNAHGKLGVEIESAGIAFDNEKASFLDREYNRVALETLRELILDQKMRTVLHLTDQDVLQIQTTTHLCVLTKFFNPNSNHETTKQKLSDLLLTGRVRFVRMLYEVFKDWSPRSVEDRHKNFPVIYPIIDHLLSLKNPADRIKVVADLVQSYDVFIHMVIDHPDNDSKKWTDKKKNITEVPERVMVGKFYNWNLPGTASDIMEDLFEAFESILGMDVDDPSVWIPEFKHLVLFKRYKKVMKNLTSYVWGKNGRGRIALIDRDSVKQLGSQRIPGHCDPTPNGKLWIKEPEIGVVTAATKRWRSGDHTIPAESELIDLRISRFPDGIRIHYDYAQMELRIAAFLAQDENLLGAFARGEDIHLFIAENVWKKPAAQISKHERRFSKSGTFAILYGDVPSGFAVKFMHGDVPAATALFDNFYGGFPAILVWIKKQHRLSLNTGIITTYLGDPLDVEMPYQALNLSDEDKDLLAKDPYTKKVTLSHDWREDRRSRHSIAKAFRNAQNYPIQCLSSVLAGYGIQHMNEYLRSNRMTARIDLFTHDSGDIDAQLVDVPKIVSKIPETSVERIQNEFGISVKTDVEIGFTGNVTIELSQFTVNGAVIEGSFKAKRSSLLSVIDRLQRFQVRCAYTIRETKIEASSVKDLFKQKKAYSIDVGTPKEIVMGSISLDFSDVQRDHIV